MTPRNDNTVSGYDDYCSSPSQAQGKLRGVERFNNLKIPRLHCVTLGMTAMVIFN